MRRRRQAAMSPSPSIYRDLSNKKGVGSGCKDTNLKRRAQLVGEGPAPDGRTALACTGWITRLDHETANVAMEDASVVVA